MQALVRRQLDTYLLLGFSSLEPDIQIGDRLRLLDAMGNAWRNEHEIARLDFALDAATNRAPAELTRGRARLGVDERAACRDDARALAHHPDLGDPAVLQRRFRSRNVPHVDAEA